MLDLQPHKSIYKYYGVETSSVLRFKYRNETINITMDQERVLNLVFEKYDCNLREAIERGYPVHIRDCLQSIAAGIEHMHSLKLVHGDVKPENILVKWSNSGHDAIALRYVIGDFDSTQWKGSVIGGKYGTPFWSRDKKTGVDIVEEDDDWFGFDQLRKWLVCFTTDSRQKSEDYRRIGKRIGGTDARESTITYSSV
jgi:serine/threonine protein kinase